jgi:hypothetical protein
VPFRKDPYRSLRAVVMAWAFAFAVGGVRRLADSLD